MYFDMANKQKTTAENRQSSNSYLATAEYYLSLLKKKKKKIWISQLFIRDSDAIEGFINLKQGATPWKVHLDSQSSY